MANNKEQEIKVFKFGQLKPSSASDVISPYRPETIDPSLDFKKNIPAEVIRGEREFEKNSSFKISEMVREHRGIKRQEAEDIEAHVEAEIQRRLEAIAENAREEGYQAGLDRGREEAYAEASTQFEVMIEDLKNEVESIQTKSAELLEKNKQQIYLLVKNLVKWVAIKEIDDKGYLPKLLEKLIYEINKKTHLVIRVNEAKFSEMPEIIQNIETRLGTLTNVRVEIGPDLKFDGLVIEAENAIVDGSLEAQFHSIDRIFEQIGVGIDDNI